MIKTFEQTIHFLRFKKLKQTSEKTWIQYHGFYPSTSMIIFRPLLFILLNALKSLINLFKNLSQHTNFLDWRCKENRRCCMWFTWIKAAARELCLKPAFMAYFFHILRIMLKRANCSEKGDFTYTKPMLVNYNWNYEFELIEVHRNMINPF